MKRSKILQFTTTQCQNNSHHRIVLHQLSELEMDRTCNTHCQMTTTALDNLPIQNNNAKLIVK